MKKLLAITLLVAAFASPVFAKSHKHPNYRYKAPKTYKLHFHHVHHQHQHPHHTH